METLECHQDEGLVCIYLKRGKVNPMNRQLIEELTASLKEVESDEGVRGVILTGQPGYFSAGLDLKELVTLDSSGMDGFWRSFYALIGTSLSFKKPLVCAINGHSPAGGCVVALSCDVRIMANGEGRIGLNEIPVGIQVPTGIHKLMSYWVGEGRAAQLLLRGSLLLPNQALTLGMVDEVVAPDELMNRAKERVMHLMSLPPQTWSSSKLNFRRDLIGEFSKPYEEVFGPLLSSFSKPEFQECLQKTLSKLKG